MARTRIRLVAALATTAAALAAPTTASAVTCDGLQTALDNSTNGGTVTVDAGAVCAGHWDLPSHTITLQGGGDGATLTGDTGEGRSQILYGESVGSTTIRNLTFVEGQAESDDELTDGNGGAIYIEGESPVTIEDNAFFQNDADANGGAVALVLDNQVFAPLQRGDASPVILRRNDFGAIEAGEPERDFGADGNDADGDGGAVYVSSFFRDVVVDDNLFAGNDSDGDPSFEGDGEHGGGGLRIDAADVTVLTGNTFFDNETAGDGGGASASTCRAEVEDNDFIGNIADGARDEMDGGGLYLDNVCRNDKARGAEVVQVVQSGNLFQENEIGDAVLGAGGGEMVRDLTVSSTNDSFVGNSIEAFQAAGGGGLAVFTDATRSLAARNLVAAGNEAGIEQAPARGLPQQTYGGGVFVIGAGGSEFRIEDSTIEGNTAQLGSGIFNVPPPSGGENTRAFARGQIQGDELVLQNSIVYGNVGSTDEIQGFGGTDVSYSDTCLEGGAYPGEGNLCVDPGLTAPNTDGNVNQVAGGPTIDRGSNALVDGDLTGDYAGDARVSNGKVDMGADEYKVVTQQPQPQPTAQQPPPPAAGGVAGTQQKKCVSRRIFRIRLRIPKGKKALSATVRVNGKKVRVVRGKRLRAPVRLRGLPKGKIRVRITIRLANGRKISGVRTYHTCIPKLPGDGPPKV
jgi:hypothetical protein